MMPLNTRTVLGGTMHARTTTIAVLLTLAAATASCSSDTTDSKPDKPTTATTSATPTVDEAAARQACTDAVQAAIDAGTDDQAPAECSTLDDSEYADLYFDAVQDHNQQGRDELERLSSEAATADQ